MEIDSLNIYDKTSLFQKKAESASETKDGEALREVCKEFESIFINMMLKEMKNTVPDGGLIPKGSGTRIFEEMYMEEISKEVSTKGEGIGIAKMLYEQFTKGYIKL